MNCNAKHIFWFEAIILLFILVSCSHNDQKNSCESKYKEDFRREVSLELNNKAVEYFTIHPTSNGINVCMTYLDMSISYTPTLESPYINKISYLMSLEKPAEALAVANAAIENIPNDSYFYFLKAMILKTIRQDTQAIDFFKLALSIIEKEISAEKDKQKQLWLIYNRAAIKSFLRRPEAYNELLQKKQEFKDAYPKEIQRYNAFREDNWDNIFGFIKNWDENAARKMFLNVMPILSD